MGLNSCKAEYIVFKEANKELISLNTLFKQINIKNNINILYEYNKLAINLFKNLEYYARYKHSNIQYYFI